MANCRSDHKRVLPISTVSLSTRCVPFIAIMPVAIMVRLARSTTNAPVCTLKPTAPAEIRGEFQAIKTNVSGIEISEIFPKIAAIADKCAFIRTVVGATGGHDAYQCMTGRPLTPAATGGWPSAGPWISKLKGPVNQTIPPHLSLCYKTDHAEWGYDGDGGLATKALLNRPDGIEWAPPNTLFVADTGNSVIREVHLP